MREWLRLTKHLHTLGGNITKLVFGKRGESLSFFIDNRPLYNYNMTMFNPEYTLTNSLVINIRKVGELIGELNSKSFSKTILFDLESKARILSSFTSTKIEGNPLSLTDVKHILQNKLQNIKDMEREVLNYNNAISLLDKKIKNGEVNHITNKLVCDVQGVITKGLLLSSHRAKYRTEPVFVNNPLTGETVYWPPDAKDVRTLMRDLISFVNNSEGKIDPLIIAGIFHKQCVVIHPFMDGNGRTARLLTKSLLAKLGVNTFPLFSFENYYNKDITKYFNKVGVIGNYYDIFKDIDFTEWLEYFVGGILDELKRINNYLPQYNKRLESHEKKMVKYLRDNGSISSSEYYKISKRARSTRIKDFRELTDRGIIKSVGQGKSTYYVLEDDYSYFE